MHWNGWLVLWSLWAARLVRQPTGELRTSGGWLRGEVVPTGYHRRYMAIPYGTVRKFKAPGPEPTWSGVFEAINENVRCSQPIWGNKQIGRDECLTINVYTPLNVDPDERLPVMVFVHGGGFFEGSSNPLLYGPENLVTKGVILVTFNYRLNVQGLLCLKTKDAPGNAGMKDQVQALKWVQRNIKAFGGDPDNVTLFGESAGGSSVSLHVVSEMSTGLFQKAIIQSGASMAPWSLELSPLSKASALAKGLGYFTEDPQKLYQIFSNKTYGELINVEIPREKGAPVISELLFVPCIENKIEGEQPFITESPYLLLSQGRYNKMPIIIGATNKEGYMFMGMESQKTLRELKIEKSLPANINFPSEEIKNRVTREIKELYLRDETFSTEMVMNFTDVYEAYFTYPVIAETDLLLKTNDKPVYNYLFQYSGWRNMVRLISGRYFWYAKGASHADDLFYIFSQEYIPNFYEIKFINKVSRMWTNFAKYGDPTPEQTSELPVKWWPSNKSSPQSLVIDTEFQMGPLFYNDRLRYWHQLYSKYRQIS